MALDDEQRGKILAAQRNEITEHILYEKLSNVVKDKHNSRILKQISEDEKRHCEFWKQCTHKEVKPDKYKVWWYYLISRVFGLTFGIKLMEMGEKEAQAEHSKICDFIPDARQIVEEENEHEKQLINMLDEERLKYVGSMVLGLNDALVELTGALAGFTLAFQNTRLVAVTGLITGIAASLSMASSEYLSTKSEENGKHPVKASMYTGGAYVLTVIFLILPYLIFENIYYALALTLLNAVLVISVFTFYISVVKDLSFKGRFLEMAGISLGVAAVSFAFGYLIRELFGIEI